MSISLFFTMSLLYAKIYLLPQVLFGPIFTPLPLIHYPLLTIVGHYANCI